MKKGIIAVILFLIVPLLSAQSEKILTKELRSCIAQFSKTYAEQNPGLATRKGAIILDFTEVGSRAQKNKLGLLVETYLQEQMGNSIIFYLVDRKNLQEILKEQSLSMSGLVKESTAPKIGELSGASVFLSGEVIENGQTFKVSIKLTDASKSEILDTYTFSIPGDEMIDASVNLQYSYVAKNGIGIGYGIRYLITAPENFTKSSIIQMINEIGLKYRVSKSFLVELGVWLPLISKTDSFYDLTESEVLYGTLQPGLPATLANYKIQRYSCAVQEMFISHLGAQYTLNFSPKFNIGVKAGALFLTDTTVKLRTSLYRKIETLDSSGTNIETRIQLDQEGMDIVFNKTLGGKVEISPEFFITSRFALNLTVGYIMLKSPKIFEIRKGTSDFNEDDYFGFDPTKMPDGTPWTFDYSGLYAGFSMSVFF